MSVDVFLDTNILVYCFDKTAPAKRARALELVRADHFGWGISWQVMQEFCFVALHRFETPLKSTNLREYLDLVLVPHCVVHSSPIMYRQALELHQQTQYRFYDALVIASAIHAGASCLYSEDLQQSRNIGVLKIVNPFAGA